MAAVGAMIGLVLTAFGAGDLIPYVGSALQGLLAVGTFGVAAWSWWKHHTKTAAIVAAGIAKK